ncbi:Ig-like domain-containing protein [Amycolatopsis ultiminotia]|uniref:Ig-like domain-containing protein n=1 Tax=Amycolatopsis ultiminotia TaxID=543629 RepID=A0ABP6WLH5_9PSEU
MARVTAQQRDAARRHRIAALLAVAALGAAACTSATDRQPATAGTSAAPAKAASIAIEPVSADPVSPATPVVVRATDAALTGVTVTNTTTGKQVSGRMTPDKRTWTASEPLAYGISYQVKAYATTPDGKPVEQTGSVRTLQPRVQAFPSFIPAPNVPDVGVGQPLVVKFDQDVADKAAAEKALQVNANPPQAGGWYWLSKREVHYRPQNYWRPGSTVTLTAKVYGVNLGNGVYGQTDRTETLKIHDSWIAKADGKTEKLQIFHNGQLVNTMPMSLGSPGFPTHEGTHVVSDKQPSIIMDSCTYGVCKGQSGYYREQVALDERISNDGEFVHSAPWSVGQQGNSNVSHGCVNLAPADAQWFYDRFGLGDVVEITNSGGSALPVWDTYGDWAASWPQWQAGSALH